MRAVVHSFLKYAIRKGSQEWKKQEQQKGPTNYNNRLREYHTNKLNEDPPLQG